MIALNLPAYTFRIKADGDKSLIYDELRRRFVSLTPEEWVRQHFVRYLIEEKVFLRPCGQRNIPVAERA